MANRSAAAKKGWETRRKNKAIKERLERALARSVAQRLAYERKQQLNLEKSNLSKQFKERHSRKEEIKLLENKQKKVREPVNPIRSAAAKKGWETRRKKEKIDGPVELAEISFKTYVDSARANQLSKVVESIKEEFKPGAMVALEDTISSGMGFWDACEYIGDMLEIWDIEPEDIREWYDEGD